MAASVRLDPRRILLAVDTRLIAAVVLNVLMPGAGLIVTRREWLGLAMALLFAIAADVCLWGLIVAPGWLPVRLVWCAFAASCTVWVVAQALLWQQIRLLSDPHLAAEHLALKRRARDLMAEGAYEHAWGLLKVAMRLDDEDPEVYLHTGELMILLGRWEEAARALRLAARLGRGTPLERRALEALRRLPGAPPR